MVILALYFERRDQEEGEEGDEGQDSSLPYRKKYYLFSEAEKKFYDVLKVVLKENYLIFAKVRVADLIYYPSRRGKWQSNFNRIKAKHVDFVICDKFKISPILVIELDDSSHNRYDRQKRDNFIDQAFNVAQLPILHIKNSYQYNPQELLKQIQSSLNNKPPQV